MKSLWVVCLWALLSTVSASPRTRVTRQVNDDQTILAETDVQPGSYGAPTPAVDANFASKSVDSGDEEIPCNCKMGHCVCVPYYLCDANRTIIENGEGMIDIRMKPDNPCIYMDVCCFTGEVLATPITPRPPTVPPPDSGSFHIEPSPTLSSTESSPSPTEAPHPPPSTEVTEAPQLPSSTEVTEAPQPPSSTEVTEAPQPPSSTEVTEAPQPPSSTEVTEAPQPPSSTEVTEAPQPPSSTEVTEAPQPHSSTEVCGIRNEIGVSSLRISGNVNGETQFGEFPWMVAVMKQDEVNGESYQCGGSLISSQVVLTAAHCVQGKTGLFVRAGEWDTQLTTEPLPTQDRSVHRQVIHENYYSGGLHNDVALLFLENPLDTQIPNVATICLPDQDESMNNRTCVATGWGKDLFGQAGHYQVILKKVDLPTVPRNQCQKALRKTKLGNRFKLHSSFLCAGGEVGVDTCQGDGGGPLICPSSTNPRMYIQAGIVSWGIGCATETPGVYVDVAKFRHWIDSHLNTLSLDPRLPFFDRFEYESSGPTPIQDKPGAAPIDPKSPVEEENDGTIITTNV